MWYYPAFSAAGILHLLPHFDSTSFLPQTGAWNSSESDSIQRSSLCKWFEIDFLSITLLLLIAPWDDCFQYRQLPRETDSIGAKEKSFRLRQHFHHLTKHRPISVSMQRSPVEVLAVCRSVLGRVGIMTKGGVGRNARQEINTSGNKMQTQQLLQDTDFVCVGEWVLWVCVILPVKCNSTCWEGWTETNFTFKQDQCLNLFYLGNNMWNIWDKPHNYYIIVLFTKKVFKSNWLVGTAWLSVIAEIRPCNLVSMWRS